MQIYINALRHSNMDAYNVYTSHGMISNVVGNVVRTALGMDVYYLLTCPTRGCERFRPISERDWEDFKKYRRI